MEHDKDFVIVSSNMNTYRVEIEIFYSNMMWNWNKSMETKWTRRIKQNGLVVSLFGSFPMLIQLTQLRFRSQPCCDHCNCILYHT